LGLLVQQIPQINSAARLRCRHAQAWQGWKRCTSFFFSRVVTDDLALQGLGLLVQQIPQINSAARRRCCPKTHKPENAQAQKRTSLKRLEKVYFFLLSRELITDDLASRGSALSVQQVPQINSPARRRCRQRTSLTRRYFYLRSQQFFTVWLHEAWRYWFSKYPKSNCLQDGGAAHAQV
jgi:hypothetical protein